MAHYPVKICRNIGKIEVRALAQPDPFILRWKNEYFCYVSGNDGIAVLISKKLNEFIDNGFAYENIDEYSFWAPAVFYWKGKFYLYYSSLMSICIVYVWRCLMIQEDHLSGKMI